MTALRLRSPLTLVYMAHSKFSCFRRLLSLLRTWFGLNFYSVVHCRIPRAVDCRFQCVARTEFVATAET
jgi:hypothetical protein